MMHKFYFTPNNYCVRNIFSELQKVIFKLPLLALLFSLSNPTFAVELKDKIRFNYGYDKITAKNPLISEDQVTTDETFTPKESIRHTHIFGLTYLYLCLRLYHLHLVSSQSQVHKN
jgi:hypothetical protein